MHNAFCRHVVRLSGCHGVHSNAHTYILIIHSSTSIVHFPFFDNPLSLRFCIFFLRIIVERQSDANGLKHTHTKFLVSDFRRAEVTTHVPSFSSWLRSSPSVPFCSVAWGFTKRPSYFVRSLANGLKIYLQQSVPTMPLPIYGGSTTNYHPVAQWGITSDFWLKSLLYGRGY